MRGKEELAQTMIINMRRKMNHKSLGLSQELLLNQKIDAKEAINAINHRTERIKTLSDLLRWEPDTDESGIHDTIGGVGHLLQQQAEEIDALTGHLWEFIKNLPKGKVPN